jgi:hypothetical protein
MILVSQSDRQWQYFLNAHEAEVLAGLLQRFPFTDLTPRQISQMADDPAMAEREKLLNESLAEHRKELAKVAMTLTGHEHWKKSKDGSFLTLNPSARELLLQILNDIRVGCWRALGEPEPLEKAPPTRSAKGASYRHLMDLAGYFEANLLAADEL